LSDACPRSNALTKVVILDRQQVGLAGFEPAMCGTTLAPGAMPVTTGVVSDLLMFAGRTTQYMTAECCTAASLDGRHHLELVEADVPCIRLTPYLSLGAEDVRDLQGLSGHDPLMWVSAGSPADWSLPAVYPWQPGHRGWSSPICYVRAIPGSVVYRPSALVSALQTNVSIDAGLPACRSPHRLRRQ